MALTILVIVGVLGVAIVAVVTLVMLRKGHQGDVAARARLDDTTRRGALPPSLHPRIDPERCIGSGSCVAVCPEKTVLAVVDGVARLVDPTVCIGHGECLRACPVDAITLVLGNERRGVDIPLVEQDFQTGVPGLYVVGELGGMGLIYNAMTQAMQCLDGIARRPPPSVEGVHQVAIVGAGPAGIAATLSAKAHGLDHVCLDQEAAGGTVLHYPRQKVVMTRPVVLPLYGRLSVGEIRKEALLDLWSDIFAKTGIGVREGVRVEGVRRGGDGVFTLVTSQGEFRAQRVVLALGRRGTPRKLGVPGEESSKVTYRLVEAERYEGHKVLVVGGGDAAVEAAVSLGAAGAETSLSYRRDGFDRIKPKNQQGLDEAVAAGRVRLLLGSTVQRIEPTAVVLEDLSGTVRLENDYVVVSVGGVLPTKFLEDAGVTVQQFKGEAYAPANR